MDVDAEDVVDSNEEGAELQIFTQIPSQLNPKIKRILPNEEDSNDDTTFEILTQVMVKKNQKKTVHFNLDASYA